MKKLSPVERINQQVIDKVVAFRYEKGLSQAELAAIMKVRRGFIGNVESFHTRAFYNVCHLNYLACYFKVPIRHFLPDTPSARTTAKAVLLSRTDVVEVQVSTGKKYYLHPMKQYIIDAVTAFRVLNGITQRALGDALGVNKGFISNVESPGNRATYNISHVINLCQYYGVAVSIFLPEEGIDTANLIEKNRLVFNQLGRNYPIRPSRRKKYTYGRFEAFRW